MHSENTHYSKSKLLKRPTKNKNKVSLFCMQTKAQSHFSPLNKNT